MPARVRRGGWAMLVLLGGRLSWPNLSTAARTTLGGIVSHAAGRGGPEADRQGHQAPAGRPEGRSRAQRAADLARRGIAHDNPLGVRRFLLVGLRATPRQSNTAQRPSAGPRAQC